MQRRNVGAIPQYGEVQRSPQRDDGPHPPQRQGQFRTHQMSAANLKQASTSGRTVSPPLASNDTRSHVLDQLGRGVSQDRQQSKKHSSTVSSARGKGGVLHTTATPFASHPNGQREMHCLGEVGQEGAPEAPSEAPSSAAHSGSQFALSGMELERMSADDRIRRLENSLNERLVKSSSEAMQASLTLCKAAEDRLMQKMDSFRRDIQKDLAQAVQKLESSAEKGVVALHQGPDFDRLKDELMDQFHQLHQVPDVSRLKDGLMDQLHHEINQEFSHLRLELAARGVPVMAGLPATGEKESLGAQGSSKKPGIAGLVGVISDCVIEKVKEDQCIRNVYEQHEQLKDVIKELREIPLGNTTGEGMHAEFNSLRNMIRESLNISHTLAKQLDIDRKHKDNDVIAATQRLKVMEQELESPLKPYCSSSLPRPSQPVVGKKSRTPSMDSNSSLDRVMGGLQRLVRPQEESRSRPGSVSPRATSQNQSRAGSAHNSDDASHDFGSEVKALRSRLENIFHFGSSSESESIGTGSTGYSATVRSLPTVQESFS